MPAITLLKFLQILLFIYAAVMGDLFAGNTVGTGGLLVVRGSSGTAEVGPQLHALLT